MRALLLLPLLAALPAPSPAAPAPTDPPIAAAAPAAAAPTGLAAQPWYRPHHAVLQLAGGQGMLAAGVGYTAFRGRIDLDVLGGYVPKRYSVTPMAVFTAKVGYSPWTLPVAEGRWQLRPLTVGGFVSHTSSRGLVLSRDEKYEKGYYWWSVRTRVGGFVGGKAARVIGTTRYGRPRTLGAYYELGTNDLYLTSIFTNLGGLGVHEILTLGLGVKLDL